MIAPDENAATLALDEEGEAPQLQSFRKGKDPTHRRLQAIAGAGAAYIFAAMPEGADMSIDFSGFYPQDLPAALREIASIIEQEA